MIRGVKKKLRPLDDVAAQTGLGRRTLQTWLGQGLLTAYKIAGDRKRYIDVAELDRLRQPQAIRKEKRR
jgi:excisionase family DNA binding protein